jgi:hypothetical protein
MNITFWFMETLLKMNTSILGENGASSRLTQADRQGPAICPGNQPAQIGAALADFVRGLRGR